MAFGYYKSVTIDHTQCGASNSTNFPVTIWVTDADFKTVGNGGKVQNSSGFDIRPYADSALTTALTYELVPSTYVASTGAFEMHVKIPTVDHSTNTVFYMGLGNAALNTDGSSTGTWISSYLTVWHMPDGTTMSGADSTSNAKTLTAGGFTSTLPTATTGEIDGGASFPTFAGLFDPGFINATNPTSGLTTFSVSAWINAAGAGGSGFGRIFCIDDGNVTDTPAMLMSSATSVSFGISGGFTVTGTISANTWTYMVGTFSSGVSNGCKVYVNASVADQNTTTSTFVSGSNGMSVGNNYFGGRIFDGVIDEVRLANIALGPDWITAEYNNQKPSSTFLTWGALTPVGGGPTPTTRLPLLGVG